MTRAETDRIAIESGLKPAGGGYVGGVEQWISFAMSLRTLLERDHV